MKVELIKNGKTEIAEVNDSYGTRLLEHGKARLVKEAENMNPPEDGEEDDKRVKKTRKSE